MLSLHLLYLLVFLEISGVETLAFLAAEIFLLPTPSSLLAVKTDSFLALEAVGFMKLRFALAVVARRPPEFMLGLLFFLLMFDDSLMEAVLVFTLGDEDVGAARREMSLLDKLGNRHRLCFHVRD